MGHLLALFGWIILLAIPVLAGICGIQVGWRGFRPAGYSFGRYRITGWPARLLGCTSLMLGIALLAILAGAPFFITR